MIGGEAELLFTTVKDPSCMSPQPLRLHADYPHEGDVARGRGPAQDRQAQPRRPCRCGRGALYTCFRLSSTNRPSSTLLFAGSESVGRSGAKGAAAQEKCHSRAPDTFPLVSSSPYRRSCTRGWQHQPVPAHARPRHHGARRPPAARALPRLQAHAPAPGEESCEKVGRGVRC